jgi:uncharacterized SAM-binding protein YcdF (DUF218 family)
MAQEKVAPGLFRRREMAVPTWRGWIVIVFLLVLTAAILVRTVYPFLAVSAPKPGGVLVVEGWSADYALTEAVQEFQRHPYDKLFVTGGPLEYGAPLSEYHTYAELGAATLIKLGAGTNAVQAAPAPRVRQDRTYASAIALKKWMEEHGTRSRTINLLTLGPHARRSRLLFQKAFGNDVEVGIISIPAADYDQKRWWRSSQGVRVVTGEVLAYGYARIFFRRPKEE